jgi:cysteinyl-tRNA synthetase
MDDDFNTAKTIACLFEMATIVNSIKGQQIDLNSIHPDSILLLRKTLSDFLFDVFGLQSPEQQNNDQMNDVMQVLISLRKEAKLKKDFQTSDAIRNQLLEAGVQLKDEKDGNVTWTTIS